MLELSELALGLVEPGAEVADQRIELVDQALLVRKLHVEVEPAFGIGIGAVGHVVTIAARSAESEPERRVNRDAIWLPSESRAAGE